MGSGQQASRNRALSKSVRQFALRYLAAFLATYLLSFFQYIVMALGLSIPFRYDYVAFSFFFPYQGLFNCIVHQQSDKGKLKTREAQWTERTMCCCCIRMLRHKASSSDNAEHTASTPIAPSPEKVSVQSSVRGSSKMESIKEETAGPGRENL